MGNKINLDDAEKSPANKSNVNMLPIGISIGLSLGVALGLLLDRLAIGLSLGIALGCAIGIALNGASLKKNGKN